MRSVPDADKTGPSEIFVNQDLREDDGYIGTTVKEFDERADNSVEATEKADNTTLGDLAEDCAEDEWSCHLKGINRSFVFTFIFEISHVFQPKTIPCSNPNFS